MVQYIVKRTLAIIPTVIGATLVVFLMMKLVPGDPIDIMFRGMAQPSPEQRAALERQMGLDQPIHRQYLLFLGRAAQGDLGRSIRTKRPVAVEIASRLPNTLKLTLAGLFVAATGGICAGALAAAKRGTWIDVFSMVTAVFGLSIPSFWLGLMLILLFAVALNWLPATGSETPQGLILPAVTLGALGGSIIARMTRSTMLEELHQAYIHTARAKGLAFHRVFFKHAFRNALVPLITIIGLQAGALLAGAFVVESVFAYPGLGRLSVQAILNRDIPLVQGTILVIAVMYAVINLIVDVLYVLLDPRISY